MHEFSLICFPAQHILCGFWNLSAVCLEGKRAIATRLGAAVLLLAITRQPIVGVGLYGFTLIRVMIFINFVSYKNVIAIKILKLLCSCPNKGPYLYSARLPSSCFIVSLAVYRYPHRFHYPICFSLLSLFDVDPYIFRCRDVLHVMYYICFCSVFSGTKLIFAGVLNIFIVDLVQLVRPDFRGRWHSALWLWRLCGFLSSSGSS